MRPTFSEGPVTWQWDHAGPGSSIVVHDVGWDDFLQNDLLCVEWVVQLGQCGIRGLFFITYQNLTGRGC